MGVIFTLFRLIFMALRVALPFLAAALALYAIVRLLRRGQRREEQKPHFSGPVQTVKYREATPEEEQAESGQEDGEDGAS